jgi:hypothetical protein
MTILRQLVYYVAQKAASNPEAREKAAEAARSVIQKTKQIAKEDDRAYAAGQAVRKAFDKLKGK